MFTCFKSPAEFFAEAAPDPGIAVTADAGV